jgi:OOP family OmpA-OmpF porin
MTMKINKIRVLGLLFSIGYASMHPANATSNQDFYLAPFGSFLQTGGDTGGSAGWGVGMGVGKVLSEHFNIELRGFWQNYQNDFSCCGGTETDLIGATADVQYYFFRESFAPYLVASVGGMTTNITSPAFKLSQESFIFEAGAGTSYTITDYLILRADVRYRLNTLPDNLGSGGVLNDAVVNLGFVVPIGL